MGSSKHEGFLRIGLRLSVDSSAHCSVNANRTMSIKTETGANACYSHKESSPNYVDDDADSEENGEQDIEAYEKHHRPQYTKDQSYDET